MKNSTKENKMTAIVNGEFIINPKISRVNLSGDIIDVIDGVGNGFTSVDNGNVEWVNFYEAKRRLEKKITICTEELKEEDDSEEIEYLKSELKKNKAMLNELLK